MAKTIDNLGPDISSRYASDRQGYDEQLIKDSQRVPSQARVSTTSPSYASEFQLLFDLGKRGNRWAQFEAPTDYYVSRRRLFAEQVIPEMGSPDLQETQIERLEATAKEKQAETPSEEAKGEIEQEKHVLINLLNNLHQFDQIIIEINSRRAQYQKG